MLACLTATATSAQVTAGGAVGFSTQAKGASDVPYLGPTFGGTSVATIGMVDVVVARNASVGGELSTGGAISGTQSQRASGGANAFVSRHRDTVFSGTVKLGTPFAAPVRASAMIGAGLAYRHTARSGAFSSAFPPTVTGPFEETVSDVAFALTGGGEVLVAMTDHVGLLAAGRIHRLKDDDRRPDGVVKRGVSSTILRYGIGALIRF